jgi:hypothetical protein
MLNDLVMACEDLFKALRKLGRGYLSQESEFAEINP